MTHEIVDFGIDSKIPGDIYYPFEGTEEQCAQWITDHQEIRPDGEDRYMMQEIPDDDDDE